VSETGGPVHVVPRTRLRDVPAMEVDYSSPGLEPPHTRAQAIAERATERPAHIDGPVSISFATIRSRQIRFARPTRVWVVVYHGYCQDIDGPHNYDGPPAVPAPLHLLLVDATAKSRGSYSVSRALPGRPNSPAAG
jgi:hypothetical protein